MTNDRYLEDPGAPSVSRGRVEFLDQSLEGGLKFGFVLVGPRLNEIDDLSIVVGGLFMFTLYDVIR
jgi:hypothetical protein